MKIYDSPQVYLETGDEPANCTLIGHLYRVTKDGLAVHGTEKQIRDLCADLLDALDAEVAAHRSHSTAEHYARLADEAGL